MSESETDVSVEFLEEKTVSNDHHIINLDSDEDSAEEKAKFQTSRLKRNTSKRDAEEITADAEAHGLKRPKLRCSAEGRQEIPRFQSPIRLISNAPYCKSFPPSSNKDTVTLFDLVGSRILESSYQFNMLIDCEFLLPFFKADPLNFELILIGVQSNIAIEEVHRLQYRIKTVDVSPKLPNWGTHHSKLMINFFHDDTCQIVIHTMNLTHTDYLAQTQMCWISPRLRKLNSHARTHEKKKNFDPICDVGLVFKRDFLRYLYTYENSVVSSLVEQLKAFDFCPIDVAFVCSSPGRYEFDLNDHAKTDSDDMDDRQLYGYGNLRQILNRYKLTTPNDAKLIMQVSSISAPLDNRHTNIGTHVLSSIVEGSQAIVKQPNHKFGGGTGVEINIIWPTEEEIMNAHYGHISGHAVMFKSRATNGWRAYEDQARFLRSFFYRWSSRPSSQSVAGRSNLSPHVKSYCVTKNDFETLEWFLLTSANLSKQAWGAPARGFGAVFQSETQTKHVYTVKSFEAGVLVIPACIKTKFKIDKSFALTPVQGTDFYEGVNDDTVHYPIRLPYDTPLKKYSDNDRPWTTEKLEQIYNTT
ncbi:hypothetical protein KL911_005087 [Ogataea haglerorum]|uniref:uncharacterized protein n=1 Tax=Ogataea haglerorum TaxID=1937702 RepID=UPI001C89F087|nr:uncharacterized protein KL911_005087 [Ogataea haglerorum]KAG7744891.1 hypothetical protein KL912_005044 [Ogataea haglerorum]KAG7749880.1 hypothetical protein KL911_005087 [Ogataea haglerorum]